MIISYNWLKDYVNFDYGIEELEEKISLQGIEVEEITRIGEKIDNLIVGQVVEIKKHPDADKLSVCQVNTGQETVQIICGAPNIWDKENPKIIVALHGCYLPAVDLKIKKSKLRGEISNGMICSKEELGLAESAEGIWLLPDDAEVGKYPTRFMPKEDYLIDIAITANRGDLLGMIGVAREISAMNGTKVNYPKPYFDVNKSIEKPKIDIKDEDLCKRFTSRIIKGVEVSPTPCWIKEKLMAMGQRSINSIVDISNYVMFELGHPNHVYDLSKLTDANITIRKASDGEKMTTIDDVERTLTNKDLVIASGDNAVSIAGVMGSGSSEVDENTVDILLEVAYFEPVSVRRTAKRLGLSTDASYRFERNADIENTKLTIDRLTEIIIDVCGGKASEVVDLYPNKVSPVEMDFSISYLEKIAGHHIPKNKTISILESLEFKVKEKDDDTLHIKVPTFKTDVLRPIDVVEEITRVYGFNNIPDKIFPLKLNPEVLNTKTLLKDSVRQILVGFGMTEFLNHSFAYSKDVDMLKLDREKSVKILNPFTQDTELLRQSLIQGLVQNVIFNYSRGNKNLSAFEIGHVFQKAHEKEDRRYNENYHLGLMIYGNTDDKGVYSVERKADFFDIKGVVQELFKKLSIDGLKFKPSKNQLLHPGKSADVFINKTNVGFIGEMHPIIAKDYKLNSLPMIGEIDLNKLESIRVPLKSVSEISKFPPVYRDANFEVDCNIAHGDIAMTIERSGGKILESYRLVDIYIDDKLKSDNKKSMTYELIFRDLNQTLKDSAVDKVFDKIVKSVEKSTGGKIRGV